MGSPWPTDAKGWSSAFLADLDLDTWPDMVGLASLGEASVSWARNEGKRLAARPLAVGPGPVESIWLAVADLIGDPLPDLVLVADEGPPWLARNLGIGRRWLALDLPGRWKDGVDRMKTNPLGLGFRLDLEGQGLPDANDHTTPEAGRGQSVAQIVLGLGIHPSSALLRLRRPSGTIQCERNVAADQTFTGVEHDRKSGSCPVHFT